MKGFMITDHALETQRSVVIEEINQNVNNTPYGRWRFAQQAVAFDAQSSYSWEIYGSSEHVAAVSMDDARSFFDRYYRPSNAVLCVAGDISPDAALTYAERHFGGIPGGSPVIRNVFDPSWRRRGGHVTQPDSVAIPAVFISVHLPGDREAEPQTAEIAATLLGSGRTSALYRNLVVDQRVASSVGAYADRRDHTTLLTLYAFATTPEVSPDVLASAILEAARAYAPTDDDTAAAANKQATAVALELQRNSGVADSVAWHTIFKDDPTYVNTLVERYRDVQTKDVDALLRSYVTHDNSIRVDVIPE
jgi:zinc protease